jgi:hypothetical protein
MRYWLFAFSVFLIAATPPPALDERIIAARTTLTVEPLLKNATTQGETLYDLRALREHFTNLGDNDNFLLLIADPAPQSALAPDLF